MSKLDEVCFGQQAPNIRARPLHLRKADRLALAVGPEKGNELGRGSAASQKRYHRDMSERPVAQYDLLDAAFYDNPYPTLQRCAATIPAGSTTGWVPMW